MSKANKLITIGHMGGYKAYLNTPMEEAKRLYKEETGDDADDWDIKELEFNRSFSVYDAWEEEPENHTPALGPKFDVKVVQMNTSAGDEFIVAIDRPDRPNHKGLMDWELGRYTPFMSRVKSQADYTAAEWDHFLNNPTCEKFDPHLDLMMQAE